MIVRISGTGQFDVPDDQLSRLNDLDDKLTEALHSGKDAEFHQYLNQMIQVVKDSGSPLGDGVLVPSKVIVPPEDISLEEAQRFFTDEGLLEPVEA